MTAVSVPNPSNRGCPSSLAGTTCRRDRSRISAYALGSTIRCRTDRSGPFRRCLTHPRLPATVPSYSHPTTESDVWTPTPSHQEDNLSPEPFPGLPVGGKRAFPLLTVSAPNSSQKDNSLQNRRDRRPPHSRPVRYSRRGDRSPHHAPDHGRAIVFRETKTRLHVPVCSTSRTPTSTGLFPPFCHRGATTTPRHAPPPQAHFCHFRPNWGLSSKCSPILPMGGRFDPVSALPRPV